MFNKRAVDTTAPRGRRRLVTRVSDLQLPRDDAAYAIVVGLNCITGLQSARILAARGVPVVGLASNLHHYCCQTRSCEAVLETDTASDKLIECLVELGPQLARPAVLVPCSDLSVLAISRHRERLQPWYRIGLPEHDVVELLMDKLRFYEYAETAGLPIPRTALLRDRKQAESAARNFPFPAILKPPVKTPTWEANTKFKVFHIQDAQHLLAMYDRCQSWADAFLLQEWIEGGEANLYSCNCYFDGESQPLVTFIARKLRQWPPGIGTSCLGEECRNDVVLQETLRLFGGVAYQGLGYVEMKEDARTGRHVIIEPNIGRPTGRSAIAEAGGVDLLYTMYCDLTDRPLPQSRRQDYRGAKWIYWRRDFQSALYYWKRGELTIWEWLRSWRGRKRSAVFSWTDPGPFCADLWRLATSTLRRKRRPAQARPSADSNVARDDAGVLERAPAATR